MIPTLIAAAMLFGCLLPGLPYGYFVTLRWVVCATSLYRVIISFESPRRSWLWPFVVIAVLFNPVWPVQLGRRTWLVIDGVTGVTMFVSLAALKNKEKEP